MNKNLRVIVIVILGLALLGGAAFVAARLLQNQTPASAVAPGPRGKGQMGQQPTELPNDLLPKRDFEVAGTVSRVENNSIFIEPAFLDVPEVEVVVGPDTHIYLLDGLEVLAQDEQGNPTVVRTKLKEITIDDLQKDDILSIWADQRGERYNAQVIRVLR